MVSPLRKFVSKIRSRTPRPTPPRTPALTSPTPQLSSSGPETPPQSLQAQLWNQAYDELKASEPDIVEAYEKILSCELDRDSSTPTNSASRKNAIEPTRERWRQMEQIVQAGLKKTEKEAAVMQGIDDGLQAAYSVKDIADKAVQAAPEAALAWVGVCFALEILSNPITEAGINRQGIAYVVSRMDWYWNLAGLLLDKNRAEPSSAGLRDQLEKHVVQLYQKLLLYQMRSVCRYYGKRAAVLIRDIFTLDDWESRLQEIRDAEDAVRQDSDQYNTQEIRTHLQALATTASSQQRKLQDIYSAIQDQTTRQEKMQQDERDRKCLEDLRETDPRDDKTRIQETKGGLLKDSYRWILDHADFRQWRDDPQNRLLWIKGDPGKGKTMLLCGIIDELKECGNCLSYFFCQATEARLSNATAVLRGLIYMLVDQQPSLISHVREKHDHAGKQLFEDGNAWEALSKILAAMLNDPILDGAILVVDGLDECEARRDQLLDFILNPSLIKWIVSSRNWQDIEEKLGCTKQKVKLQLELNQTPISKAVDTYIEYKVDELACLKNYDQKTRDAVQRHLVGNADGTFLWVALVSKELADSKAARKRHTLSKLKSFPPGLDPLYKRMMKQISNSDDADICKEILAIASVVYRPVTLEELKVLAESLEEDDYNDLPRVIKACGSFLALRKGVVYFVHQSAKDFLVNKAHGQILHSGIGHQHRFMLSRSLDALSRTLRRDIYNLRAPGFSIDEVSPPDPDPLAPIRYSCTYWADHLSDSDSAERMGHGDLQDGGIVNTFLKENYLYWLEALSLLHSMSEGVMAVQKLKSLVRNTETQYLRDLLRDAHRFVLFYRRAVEIAPLQVYASALVFSPSRSSVRDLLKEEAPEWIVSKPAMEADWNACLQTLEGHSGSVISVAFSGDGQRLASASIDNTIKVWDPAIGACLQTLEGHSDWVSSVAFSGDSQQLASASVDKTIKVWDPATGACLRTLKGHSGSVCSVAFSGDSQQLASASYDKTVKVWDPATGASLQTLKGHSGSVSSVAFSGNGQQLASASYDNTVKVWDLATGACLQTLEGHSDSVISVAFSGNSQQLASASYDKTAKVWDPATGACLQTLEGHSGSVSSVAFSGDGQRLASASYDKTAKVWDPATGACLQTLEIGRVVFHLSFDAKSNSRLSTDIGVLNLDVTSATNTQPSVQRHNHCGYGISPDSMWIVKDAKRVLWLPPEYRPVESAVAGSTVAIGCGSGRVFVMQFSANGPDI